MEGVKTEHHVRVEYNMTIYKAERFLSLCKQHELTLIYEKDYIESYRSLSEKETKEALEEINACLHTKFTKIITRVKKPLLDAMCIDRRTEHDPDMRISYVLVAWKKKYEDRYEYVTISISSIMPEFKTYFKTYPMNVALVFL